MDMEQSDNAVNRLACILLHAIRHADDAHSTAVFGRQDRFDGEEINTSERHDVHRQAFLDHYCRCGRAQLSAYPPVGLLLIARLYETLAVKLYTVPL